MRTERTCLLVIPWCGKTAHSRRQESRLRAGHVCQFRHSTPSARHASASLAPYNGTRARIERRIFVEHRGPSTDSLRASTFPARRSLTMSCRSRLNRFRAGKEVAPQDCVKLNPDLRSLVVPASRRRVNETTNVYSPLCPSVRHSLRQLRPVTTSSRKLAGGEIDERSQLYPRSTA